MSNDILLIDDEETFAAMLRDLLVKHGYRSEYCLNPEEALERLRDKDFGLVVSDYKMPEMDGADFLVEARKISPDLPVIMISGLMNMPELIKVANIGVTLALEKPFDTEDFLEHVARFVEPAGGGDAEQGEPEPSYPHPPVSMADSSAGNRRFLETLWTNANQFRHLFVEANREAETDALMKEILGWLEAPASGSTPCMSISDTATGFTRDWLEKQEPFPPLLVMDLRGDEEPARIHALTGEWITHVEQLERDLSASRLLYLLPPGFPFRVDSLGLAPEGRDLVATTVPVLPALRERVADVADYLRRELPAEVLRKMGEAEREFLLQHSWPGGYEELRHRARQIKEEEVAGVPRLRELLGSGGEGAADLSGDTGPAAFLKRRQREFLEQRRLKGETWADFLQRLGLPSTAPPEEAILREEVLLYPEVLEHGEGTES